MIFLKKFFLILLFFYPSFIIAQKVPTARNLIAPEGSITSTTVTLLWDKPKQYKDIVAYQIFKDGELAGTSTKANFTVENLEPEKKYQFYIKAQDKSGQLSTASHSIHAATKIAGKVFNILDYGAKGDGTTKNTKAIQQAIDACTSGGTVYIPTGTFLSGALHLKSNMTLYIADGGVLKGSTDTLDYLPVILNRFEGWELKTYASLINAGTLDRSGKYNVVNLSLRGKGTISGGGAKLSKAMVASRGMRGRGRLICIMNGRNIDIQGLNIENPPCWTTHYIYCNQVTLHDLHITSSGANGDGIDPDSSTDSYIFNCTISTDDDCIAIKSGKNPEGNVVNKPTKRVRITDCTFIKGAALAIGSEMSGGVSDVFIQDCKIGNLKNGLQIKTTKDRGGYVKNLVMRDCSILKITMVTNVNYNNDGAPAPKLAWFKDMEFTNLDMTGAKANETLMDINGFPDEQHYTRHITFTNIKLPQGAKIKIKNCDNVIFKNVADINGTKPAYLVSESNNIVE
jgi:polygalacturonase